MLFIDDGRSFESTDNQPENWHSVEFEVNSNGKIIDGVNHCYVFGKVNDETVFSDNDLPCPTLSSPYSNPNYNISSNSLPYVGGGSYDVTGILRLHNFEWLEGATPTATTTTSMTTTTLGETLLSE